MHWKSHRHIDRYTKDLVKQLRDNNVSLGKVFSIVGSFFGAAENVPFTKRSLKTLCRKLNKEQSDLDAVKTMNMLADMKVDDPEFNYTVQVGEESRIRTLMWVTSRGCDQYRYSGDAITFDTTYRTNLYDMPFGLFVGVNNHFQSIKFGGAMMRDEKEETFKWIFREFVCMVGGKHPQTILTDQARSMELAIEAELPNTVHRWCKWHVLKKAKKSMGVLWSKNSDFKLEFHKLVHHMITKEEFEAGWDQMLEKYSLRKHPFLTQIYEVRHKWAKSYFRGVFCARMTSTQRSESANHLLKGYVPPGCPMHNFLLASLAKNVTRIIFCDYHEHGMQGREGLPLPRLAHYSDTFMRLQVKKHAARNGVDVGFEVSDVPRSPAFNVASGSAALAQPLNTPSLGVHATAAGFGMAQDKEVDPQVCYSFFVCFCQVLYG